VKNAIRVRSARVSAASAGGSRPKITAQRRLMALLFKKVVKVDSADAEATKNMAGKLGGGLTCLITQVTSSRTNTPLFSFRTNSNADRRRSDRHLPSRRPPQSIRIFLKGVARNNYLGARIRLRNPLRDHSDSRQC
jgi:hypothetical protein